ncbi:hypothetical protein [Saccharothrix deserti]|uniref:hypothetical protein n=1 Tax=Saccharothrix deserti TaxID=2593674 RepID=UPI00131C9EF6
MFVLVPAEVPKARFVDAVPHALVGALREHNATHAEAAQIRLRMALHAGEVELDEHGVTAASVNLAFRLLDARPLKAALAESPGVLALIASGWFFDEVVRHNDGAAAATFKPVQVAVKETSTVGWISLPDHPYLLDATHLSTSPPEHAVTPDTPSDDHATVPEAARGGIRTVAPGRRRRPPRWTLALGAGALAIAVGWSLVEMTGFRESGQPEPGEPISLVGEAKAAGGLEFALPEPLTSGAEYDALLRTNDPAYHPLTSDRFVPVGTVAVSFQIKGNRRTPVQITDVTPEITSKDPALAGTLVVYPPPGGEKPAIRLVANLDDPQLIVRDPAEISTAWFAQHHVELAKDENQQFAVTFSGRLAAYSFRIVVEYSTGDGARGRLVIAGKDGLPFRLTGKPADGRYGAVYLPNFPKSGGWHACGAWAEDRCTR